MSTYHIPVMLEETLENLNIKKDAWYIDCNLGGGGHTEGILGAGGKALGIDLDPEAIREVAGKHGLTVQKVNDHLEAKSDRLILYQTNFANLAEAVKNSLTEPVLGILFDLGVSTHQLDTPERGFSFNTDAPLDMRMNPETGLTAADLINGLYEKELADLFWQLGEERFSRPIAKRIVSERQKGRVETTNQLAQIILSVRRRSGHDRTHPATRIFQALRIAVNDELNSLREALPQAVQLLSPGGRLVIISFHSLEDRIVKNFFQDEEKNGTLEIINNKPVIPAEEEVENNPRARSGKIRVAQKL